MIVTPAPLENTIEPFVRNVNRLSPYYTRFQVDIGDGIFVPNTTFQVQDLVGVFHTLPQGLTYDFHLMVKDPLRHITNIKKLPLSSIGTILIHKSVFPEINVLKVSHPDMRFGLVLNPEDTVDAISEACMQSITAIQIMTIIPGFQGQPFIPNMLNKIEQLRKRGFGGEILIDGSINNQTLSTITSLTFPPDVLGVGSYLTQADDKVLGERISFLNSQLSPRHKPQEK